VRVVGSSALGMADPEPTPEPTPPAPPVPVPLTASALAADLAVRLGTPLPIAPRLLADKCGIELAPSPGSPFDVRFFPHTLVIYDPNAPAAQVDEFIANGACAHLLHHSGHLRDLSFRELAEAVCGVTSSPAGDDVLAIARPRHPPPEEPVVFTPAPVPTPPTEPEEPPVEPPEEPTEPPVEPPTEPETPPETPTEPAPEEPPTTP
jgi:hypothetical protein